MDPEFWEKLQEIFLAASQLPIEEQSEFIEAQSRGDTQIEDALRRMLEGDRKQSVMDADIGEMLHEAIKDEESPRLDRIGPYQPLERIGQGGMGVVYRAKRDDWKINVAIKIPRSASIAPDQVDRFQEEQRVLAQLIHPAIARIYESGTREDGTPWFAMEYVDGTPITEHCRQEALPLGERLKLFLAVCDAVQYAHSQLIIHRDLKPSNIFVTVGNKVKLLDFGIAKQIREGTGTSILTIPGLHPMTLAYAAPEQILKNEVSIKTDIYALGVLLYELLSYKLPLEFAGLNALQAAELIQQTDPVKPSAVGRHDEKLDLRGWADLDTLVAKSMHKDPGQRYATVDAMAQDVRRFLADEPLSARPDSATYRVWRFVRHNRTAVVFVAAALAVIVGVVVFYTMRLTRARDAALMQATRAQRTKGVLLKILGGGLDAAPSADLRVIDLLEKAVQQEHLLNNEPEVQADLYETLGFTYHAMGEYGKADVLLQRSIAKWNGVYGKDSIESGDAIVNLAMLRIDQARYAEAEQMARHEIEVASKQRPPHHDLLSFSMTALGSALRHDGRIRESIEVLEKAIQLQTGRPEDASVRLESLGFLINDYFLAGQEVKAEGLQRREVADDARLTGARTPGVAEDLGNLSQIEIKRGHYQDAERDAREALAIDLGWYRKENAEVAVLEELLADSLLYNGKCTEASKLVKSAIPVVQEGLGEKHPFVAFGLEVLGRIAMQRGNLEEAEHDFRKMQDIYGSTYRADDFRSAVGPWRMGELYAARKQWTEAEESLRLAVTKMSTALGADSTRTGATRIGLGDVLFREGKYQDAESELRRGLADQTKEGDTSMQAAFQGREDLNKLGHLLPPAR